MFDQSSYCNDCAKITLGADKIEEMILMTENQKKKALRFPKRAALLAAALVAALCLTAAAAEVPAVQEFFATVFVTISTNGDLRSGRAAPSSLSTARRPMSPTLWRRRASTFTRVTASRWRWMSTAWPSSPPTAPTTPQ